MNTDMTSTGAGALLVSGMDLKSQKVWNVSNPDPYISFVESAQVCGNTFKRCCVSSFCSGGCSVRACTGHHRRSLFLAVQWGLVVVGSVDCLRNGRVMDDSGEGGSSMGSDRKDFASSIRHGGFGALSLDVVGGWCWGGADGVEEERCEVVRNEDGGQE